ncbi:MAG: hypothetical protein L0Z62_38800 [Gemmataceae bacterium]|nr:hypothetical protein [Gemmataceae bacterium]
MPKAKRITQEALSSLRQQLLPLLNISFTQLSLPRVALKAFEPSQVGTIVGALMDALIPHLDTIPGVNLPAIGLTKHEGLVGEREGYPDYKHKSGYRIELKLLYVDNPSLEMKKPPTPREPSARLTQKVTVKNVDPARDAMLLIAYQLCPQKINVDAASPTVIDLDTFSMIELIETRDKRMTDGGGRWFGNYETPTVLSKRGKAKVKQGMPLDTASYGMKESEGKDINEDTNFGKLKRIPHRGLQDFLAKYRLTEAKEEDSEDLGRVLKQLPPTDEPR